MMESLTAPPLMSEPPERGVRERLGYFLTCWLTKATRVLRSLTFLGKTTSSGLISKMLVSWE